MSDSEDEGAFASADEGEEVSKKKQTKTPPSADKKNPKDKSESGAKGVSGNPGAKSDSSKPKSSTAASSKPEAKKGRQQQKKKGKESGQQQEKPKADKSESPSKPPVAKDVAPTSPAKEKSPESPASKDEKKAVDGDKKAAPQFPKTVEPAVQMGKLDSNESGDGKEKDVSKKAGDIRKSIPSDEASPGNQSMSRDEPQNVESGGSSKEEAKAESDGGWGWSSWGSSLLTVASSSVQTFKTQVGDGLNTIMDTVESSLGAMDPEDFIREEERMKAEAKQKNTVTAQPSDQKEEEEAAANAGEIEKKEEKEEKGEGKQEQKDKPENEKEPAATGDGGGGWFSSWGVSELAKKVQDTGKNLATKGQTLMTEGFDAVENLASGGIDVLESIGKKTYHTLSEHDPAFRKTREYLKSKTDKPNLSSVLREAKEQAENEAEATKENEEARKAHFGTQFDEFQGIAHLEALEMLSNQSEKKVHSLLNSLSSSDLKVIKPILISIKEAFEVDEEGDNADDQKEQDFSGLVSQYVSELELGTGPDKLNKVHAMVKQWMVDFDTQESHEGETVKSIHQRAIQSLAELTSKGVEQFHKAGELVLMQRDDDKDCKERAHSFARLTGVLCHEIGNLATKFSDCLNKIAAQNDDAEDVKILVTNIYLEATNSSTYIQDAFQLLLPVLQHAAIEHNILSGQS